jgi:PAS domain S-box-containing protein
VTGTSTPSQAETDRVAALNACAIVGTEPEEEFDFLARLAAELCGTEMAGITFIDSNKQFYKSAIGLQPPEVSRKESFCDHTVASGASMVVEDTLTDERFSTSPLVLSGPKIRFYAGAPLRTGDGNVLGALCVMDTEPHDVTPHQLELLQGLAEQVTSLVERRREASELNLVRHRLERNGLLAHAAAWEFDVGSGEATWTAELRALLGVAEDVKLTIETYLECVHEEDRPRVQKAVEDSMESGGGFGYRARIVRPGGEIRTIDTQGDVEMADGVPLVVRGATVDVTELVEAERRSGEHAASLQAAFEAALDPAIVTDSDGRCTNVNAAACDLLGYASDELLGMSIGDLSAKPRQDALIAAWEAMEKTGQVRGEIELRKADGEVALVEFSATADVVPGRHLSILRDVTVRRIAEQELLESTQRLEATQALAQVGSWEWDLGSDLHVTSEQLRRMIGGGSASAQPTYEEFMDFIHPDDRASFMEVVGQCLRSREPYSLVFRVMTKTGEVRTIESHGSLKLNDAGEPTSMIGAVQDITERERAQDKLRMQAGVLDQVPAAVISSGIDRKITQWSHGAENLTGISEEEAVGQTFDELGLIPPQSRKIRDAMAAKLGRGEKWEGEIEIVDKSGATFPALVTNTPIRDEDDEIAGYVGVIMDVSERQKIEKEVGLQGHLLDQVEAGVVATGLDLRITHWNRGAEKLYGWTREEAVGRPSDELNPVSDPETLRQAVTSRVRDGTSWEGEVEVRRKDGTSFPAFTSISAIRGPDGTPTGYIGVSVDISERKRGEEEIRAARLETIKRLAMAIEKRDPETGGHIERIGDLAAMIAGNLGESEERVEQIRVSSTMHDVGKVGIADGILLKAAKLTVAERAVMQTHASIGHDILAGSGADLLDLAATIALTHHEWVDGTGYPNGLSGADIPLEGRIVAVADVFDALTSDRVYRKALSTEQAVAMMEEGRGTQFDPLILDVLLDNLKPHGTAAQPAGLRLIESAEARAV